MANMRFEDLREGIYKELFKANQYFQILWSLHTPPEKVAEIRVKYQAFFFYTTMAHRDCFNISLCNIMNYHRQTRNLPRFLNYVNNNKSLRKLYHENELDEMKSLLNSHEELLKRMTVTRDQYIAHKQLRRKHFDIILPYKREQAERLLTSLNNIFNRISSRYDGRVFSFNVSPKLNVEELLRDLKQHHENELEKFRDLIKGEFGDHIFLE